MHVFDPLEPRRFLNAGDLDATFGVGGRVALPNEASIKAAGGDAFVVRLTNGLEKVDASAAPVTSFGNDGIATLPFELSDSLLLRNGKILVRGAQHTEGVDGKIERLNADGSLDTTFG